MKYYSTNHQASDASLEEAVVKGLASDKGLYMPEAIKPLPQEFYDQIENLSFQEIAYRVADAFFGEDVPAETLKQIVYDTLSFDVPAVKVKDNIYSLELFHGPTLAFKDVGGRFMAYTVFNPRTFENIWRKWQPKGNLVFSELPPEAQNALLAELAKRVQFELGDHYVNGEYGDDDDHLFNGILTQMAKDTEVIVVDSAESTMLGRLKAMRAKIPVAIRNNPDLRILMSVNDFDKYDDELTQRESKNTSETDVNARRYKGITIETLAAWPDDLIVCTLCSPDAGGNLFAAVNLQDDEDVIQIDKISNASELYFFKMLMKADTNIAFGEEVVVLDKRSNPVFKASEKKISVDPASVTLEATGGSEEVTVTASGEYEIGSAPAGFKVEATDKGVKISAGANSGSQKTGTLTLTLNADRSKTAKITITQNQKG